MSTNMVCQWYVFSSPGCHVCSSRRACVLSFGTYHVFAREFLSNLCFFGESCRPFCLNPVSPLAKDPRRSQFVRARAHVLLLQHGNRWAHCLVEEVHHPGTDCAVHDRSHRHLAVPVPVLLNRRLLRLHARLVLWSGGWSFFLQAVPRFLPSFLPVLACKNSQGYPESWSRAWRYRTSRKCQSLTR
jgi:hypothetical protein